MKLTQARLKELLHYDPETGAFMRLKASGGMKKGDLAGCILNCGYRQIRINGERYYASRLAFLYMEGYLPEHEVDHKNRIRHDDRWCNLRHVSSQCNSRNCSLSRMNKSGITGVYLCKTTQKWKAYICIFGKLIHLGYFTSKLGAARARWNAEIKYGFPNCNTTSSAYLYLRGEYAT